MGVREMYRALLSLVIVCSTSSIAFPDDKTEIEELEKLLRQMESEQRKLAKEVGDTPTHFEKHIKPLVEGITKAKTLTVYEGLPHQFWEREALAKELKEKKTVKLHDFPFYEGAITLKEEDAKKLCALCSELKTFGRYRGRKMCGGYHPDWCLEFKNGDDVYRVQLCFGCHEARLFGPKNEVFSDLDEDALKKLVAILRPLRKNRPERDASK